jgi:hypothetical protein
MSIAGESILVSRPAMLSATDYLLRDRADAVSAAARTRFPLCRYAETARIRSRSGTSPRWLKKQSRSMTFFMRIAMYRS